MDQREYLFADKTIARGDKTPLQTVLDKIRENQPYQLGKIDRKIDTEYDRQLKAIMEKEGIYGDEYPNGEYAKNRPMLFRTSIPNDVASDRVRELVDKVGQYQARLTDSKGLLESGALDSTTYYTYTLMRKVLEDGYVDLPAMREAVKGARGESFNFDKDQDEKFSMAARVVDDYLRTGGRNLQHSAI